MSFLRRTALFLVACVLCLPTNRLMARSSSQSDSDSSSFSHHIPNPPNPPKPSLSADYVILGIGTAGATLAKKLSNDKKTSVIALHIDENLTKDPLIKFSKNALITVADGLIGPPFYINGNGIPQPQLFFRKLLWVLPLPLGGGSSINAGVWARSTTEVDAAWEAIAGPNWSVNKIFQTYVELEDYHGETNNPLARGEHGPIDVRQVPIPTGVSQTFTEAIINATGVDFVLDYNDPLTPIGASSQLQYTQKGADGRLRVSSATAFLNENVMTPDGNGVNGRKLKVLFNCFALRTIWKGKRAVGVEYLQDGEVKRVSANKGVVVCAGLFSSPFLMHSGIGPKRLLNKLKIPVVVNNPNVGKGLADQPRLGLLFTTNPEDTPINGTPHSPFSQIAMLPAPGGDPASRQLRFASVNQTPGLAFVAFDLIQPKSRGSIRIKSADPLVNPVIDQGFFTDPGNEDLDLLVAGVQTYIRDINIALQAIDPLYSLIFPDPAILNDTVAVTAFIKDQIASNMHFQSHCRMAARDNGGVVDSHGRVYGTENLFVADCSVAPLETDGSPMATAYLIAANIADLILEQ